MQMLHKIDIDINNCMSNASNMAGIYTGLQARVLEVNLLADYVSCTAHSLNLVGSVSAEYCAQTISLFCTTVEIYNFCLLLHNDGRK